MRGQNEGQVVDAVHHQVGFRQQVIDGGGAGAHGDETGTGTACGGQIVGAVADHRHGVRRMAEALGEGAHHTRAGLGAEAGIIAVHRSQQRQDAKGLRLLASAVLGVVGDNTEGETGALEAGKGVLWPADGGERGEAFAGEQLVDFSEKRRGRRPAETRGEVCRKRSSAGR